MRKATLLLALNVVIVGCSHLDFGIATEEQPWGESHAAGVAASDRARNARFGSALARWQAQEAPAREYAIGPGDVLEVGVLALEEPGRISTLTRTVSGEGMIGMPWIGQVACGGRTVLELEGKIKEAYAGRYLRDPQVSVHVAEYQSQPVVVTGAVSRPGLYHLTANASTVLECLAMAGGLTDRAGSELLIVHGAPQEEAPTGEALEAAVRQARADADATAVDLSELVDRGNLLLNVRVGGGDVLLVPPRAEEHIYVLGYVRQPGAYKLGATGRVDALRAVAFGGGLTGMARPGNSFLIRQSSDGQVAIPVDLRKIADGRLPPLYLQAGDTLVVGTSTLARMSEFIAPSMGATVSASASVAP